MATNPFINYLKARDQIDKYSVLTTESKNKMKMKWLVKEFGGDRRYSIETKDIPGAMGQHKQVHSDKYGTYNRFDISPTATPEVIPHEFRHAIQDEAGVMRPYYKQTKRMRDYLKEATKVSESWGEPLAPGDQELMDSLAERHSVYGHASPRMISDPNIAKQLKEELGQVLYKSQTNDLAKGNYLRAFPGAGKYGNYEKFPPIKRALENRRVGVAGLETPGFPDEGRYVRFGGENMSPLNLPGSPGYRSVEPQTNLMNIADDLGWNDIKKKFSVMGKAGTPLSVALGYLNAYDQSKIIKEYMSGNAPEGMVYGSNLLGQVAKTRMVPWSRDPAKSLYNRQDDSSPELPQMLLNIGALKGIVGDDGAFYRDAT
jgi:hypothetical protein